MLPGKKYLPEDLLWILYRRIWLVLVPFAVISAGVAVYARRLPDLYRSEAVIMVVPPRVPEGLVAPVVTQKLEDRLPAIQQQILSRTRLERIIIDLDLFQEERRTGIMEDIVERMRSSVNVVVIRGDAFRVQFTGGDARTVMRVTDRIASLLMDESTRDREVLVESTDQFLETQVEESRKRLIDHEKKVEEYRRKYAGELPAQMDSNLQAVQNLQTQIQAIVASVDVDQQHRLLLERQLAELESADDPQSLDVPTGGASPTAQALEAARKQLAQMLLTLKADHPDVQQKKREIRDLEAKLEAEAFEAPLSTDGGRRMSPVEQARQRRLVDLRNQVEQLNKQVARSQTEVQRLRTAADAYLRRAEAGPTRETEMVELNRDYQTLQGLYVNMLQKKEETNISANLERRQAGQQFKLLDQARLPTRPFSPDRHRLNLMGMAAGLGLGLALVGLLEYRNVGLQTDEELTGVLSLPVLAVVPKMESDDDRRRRTRWRLLVGACLGGTVCACLALVAYTFVR